MRRALYDFAKVLREDGFGPCIELVEREPAMLSHHFSFKLGVMRGGDPFGFDAHEEVPFIRLHRFAFDGDELRRRARNLLTNIDAQPRFLEQFTPGRLFKAFVRIAFTAGCHPEGGAIRYVETKEQKALGLTQHQSAGGAAQAQIGV